MPPGNPNKKLFLSAVSREFESYRTLLAQDLKRPALDVAVQEDFLNTADSTLQKLDDYIQACDAIVHLIGKAKGACPEPAAVSQLRERYPDLAEKLPFLAEILEQAEPEISYTQWEAYLAVYHRRPVFIYLPTDFYEEELTCPREDRFQLDEEHYQSQKAHLRRLANLGHDRGQFLNEERLSSAVLRDLVHILPGLEERFEVPPSELRHTAEKLIGRDEELTMLDQAWNDAACNVVVVRGKGGEGKTSLVATWMAELALKGWRGAQAVYDWSFYSQGTSDQTSASAETFIVAALKFFGDQDPNEGGFAERGARLARLLAEKRCLLVLDGLEPLQYPPGPMHGQLKDPGMSAILRGLAGRNNGLCVVTTREKVDEIKQHYGRSCIDHPLEFLPPLAGAALLHFAGARRAGEQDIEPDDKELQKASEEVHGHALTLFLMGQYLKLMTPREFGDILQRDTMNLADADAEYKNDANRKYGHAFKAIEAYEVWLNSGDDEARRQLEALRMLGLFDRPATRDSLVALRSESIPGLNDSLSDGSDRDWGIALSRLQQVNLVTVRPDESVDCHPLIREYFAMRLQTDNEEAWKAAHRRLYEHLCETTNEGDQPTLEQLQPLYQAVAHGCHAGLVPEALDGICQSRIWRREKVYTVRKLGAFGSDLGAIACFFEVPWKRCLSNLTEYDKAFLLTCAVFCLRALGRLIEALEPMRVALEMLVKQEKWKQAAVCASNLSQLELTLGRLSGALSDAERSVTYADRSDVFFERETKRVQFADVLHQSGRRSEAESLFRKAEEMQAEFQPAYPLLYSLQGFIFCDFLLAPAEREAWRCTLGPSPKSPTREDGCGGNTTGSLASTTGGARKIGLGNHLGDDRPHVYRVVTEQIQDVVHRAEVNIREHPNLSLLSFALDHLALSRAKLYESLLSGSAFSLFTSPLTTRSFAIEAAMSALIRAGQQQHLPHGLLTRAWYRSLVGQESSPDRAQSDLDEAWEIASRGPMPLFMADIHLYRARLFGVALRDGSMDEYPWESVEHDLAEARRLIEKHGYGRRTEELEDAEAALLG